MSDESTKFRSPTNEEVRLLSALLERASDLQVASDYLARVRVESLNDGGMGSLRLTPSDVEERERESHGIAATLEFLDEDGVVVSAALLVDQGGAPLEIDVWKTDFSPLRRVPQTF